MNPHTELRALSTRRPSDTTGDRATDLGFGYSRHDTDTPPDGQPAPDGVQLVHLTGRKEATR